MVSLHNFPNDRSGKDGVYSKHAPSPGGIDVKSDHHNLIVVELYAPEDG